MSKLYEIRTPLEWTSLNELVGTELTGAIELFNAGREGAMDILWTESLATPSAGALYKLLKKQKKVTIDVTGKQIYIKSELKQARLIISTPNNDIITGVEEALKNILLRDISGGLATIDYGHHELHEGSAFSYQDVVTLGVAASQSYLITVPSSGKVPHLAFSVTGGGIITVEAFTQCDRTGTTLQTVFNKNMNSTKTNTTTIHKSVSSGSTDGTRFYWNKAGISSGSIRISGAVGTIQERILKAGDKVLVKVTSGTASQDITTEFDWYENVLF